MLMLLVHGLLMEKFVGVLHIGRALIAGELQESSKKTVARLIAAQVLDF